MKLTKPQRRALEILKEHSPTTPGIFAQRMWPDSPSWERHSACGPYGSTTGTGIIQKGGSYLSSLSRKGWVRRRLTSYGGQDYHITGEGRAALDG